MVAGCQGFHYLPAGVPPAENLFAEPAKEPVVQILDEAAISFFEKLHCRHVSEQSSLKRKRAQPRPTPSTIEAMAISIRRALYENDGAMESCTILEKLQGIVAVGDEALFRAVLRKVAVLDDKRGPGARAVWRLRI